MPAVVIPQRHEDISRITTHYDVFDLRIERQPIERQVCFDEAPVALPLEHAQDLRQGPKTIVQPRRDLLAVRDLAAQEDKMEHNLLRPRGARLVGGRDHDVVIARDEVRPACAIQDVVLVGVEQLRLHDCLLRTHRPLRQNRHRVS